MTHTDRYTRNQTLTRYRWEYFWQDGKRVKRFTTVTVYDRATGKVIQRRKAGSAVPEHIRTLQR